MPRIRTSPEDFQVEEVPLYAPSGQGDHTFVWVEKRERNTEEVARELARAVGVRPRDVGYAGRKDRRAVTRQWLSVPGLDPARARDLELSGARILEAIRHPHKLRTGQLRANRFTLVVREVDEAAAAEARARLADLEQRGLPNRFGGQRFGRGGENLERARALLAGRERVRDRRQGRFLLSALQAAVFNRVLAERPLPPGILEEGDVAVVHRSGGLFRVEDLAREAPRAARFEVSPTGPIFGSRMPAPGGAPARREQRVLEAFGLAAGVAPPPGIRLRGGRRALRVPLAEVDFSWAEGVLRLRFMLPAGSYASVLLEELFAPTALQEG